MYRLPSSAALRLTALAVVGALALAACGGSSHTGATSTTTAAPKAGAGPLTKLAQVVKSLQNPQKVSFTATYTARDKGQTQVLTVEQDPPKSFFKAKNGEVIDTGQVTDFCSTTGAVSCTSSTTSDPVSSWLDLVSPSSTVFSLLGAQAALVTQAASASFSSATFAGQPSSCVTISGSREAGKYCVTSTGLLAYLRASASEVLTLTSYSSRVDPSDFTLPSGAVVPTPPPPAT
jgi:hypothetical protein